MQNRTTDSILAWLRGLAHEGARLVLDSRRVRPGDVFVAVPGAAADGRNFIRVAAARGAAGALMEADGALPEHHPVPTLDVENLLPRLGEIASGFYGEPSAQMTGVAVTGTNGKTTTTHWIAALFSALGTKSAVMGTVGTTLGGVRFEAPALTTPDAASLQGLLADLKRAGADAFAVEASSIGLVQGRLSGTHFRTAVFTNLTRDHLDYHGTMEAYADAKAILFAWPGLKNAVINADDPAGERMAAVAKKAGVRVWSYSTEGRTLPDADETLEARNLRATAEGMAFELVWRGVFCPVDFPQTGFFNASNLLAALAVVFAEGHAPEDVLAHVAGLHAPAGRMERVRSGEGPAPLVLVDYAHTPDALEKALESLAPVARARGGELWCVFGCGGDRDPGKRPMMGRTAAALADHVVVTSDNPRTEDPDAIIREVVAGAPEARVEADRRLAIVSAIGAAAAEDVILVAGKGHEDYQEIMGVKHPFLDHEAVREGLLERRVAALRAKETH